MFMSSVDPCILILGDRGIHLRLRATEQSSLSFMQYADDTSIFVKGSSLLSISEIINNGMKQVNEWLKNNRLSLNVSKTNYMIMSGKGKKFNENDCEIMIDNYYYYYYLFEQKYRSHIMRTCLYHNMQKNIYTVE